MESATDLNLLDDFAASRSEAVFRELVARHVHHVHSVAWRVTRSPELAADVAQRVFTRLADRCRPLPHGVALAAWLHTTTPTPKSVAVWAWPLGANGTPPPRRRGPRGME